MVCPSYRGLVLANRIARTAEAVKKLSDMRRKHAPVMVKYAARSGGKYESYGLDGQSEIYASVRIIVFSNHTGLGV